MILDGRCRFRQSRAQEILAAVLKEKLTGAVYHAENSSAWAREIADEVKLRLKGTQFLQACSSGVASYSSKPCYRRAEMDEV